MKKVGKKGEDVNRLKIAQLMIMLVLSILVFSCDLTSDATGGVHLSISSSNMERSINVEPIDMQIATYSIVMTLQDRTVTVEHDTADGSRIMIDALSAGNWELAITGKNSDGTTVAELAGGVQHISIRRGSVTSVSAALVPLTGSSALSLSVELAGDHGTLTDPHVKISIYALSENTEYLAYTTSYAIRHDSLNTKTVSFDPGWYRVEFALHDGGVESSETLIGKKVVFPRIVSGEVTEQSVVFTVGEYRVGAIGPAGGYIFHEFSADMEYDTVGAMHGSIHGATRETIQGKSGLLFANDAYVQLDGTLAIVPNIVEVRIFVSENHGDERVGIVLGNYQDSGDTHTMGWEIHQYGRPRIWWDGGEIDCKFDYNVRQSKWILLRWVRDTNSGEFVLYVDDEHADGTGEMKEIPASYDKGSGLGNDTRLSDNTRSYRIGSDYPASRQPFDGYISDLKIFDENHELVAYYPMDRWMEVAPYDLRVLSDGTPSIDPTLSDYHDAPEQHLFGYFRDPGAVEVGTGASIGSGKVNTELLVSAMTAEAYTTESGPETTASYVARLGATLAHRGFSDWFIPAKDTLPVIDEILSSHRLADFSEGFYWSSTEASGTAASAYSFVTDLEESAERSSALYVRPVRSF